MKYYKKMIGDKCYLAPISYDDIEKYTEWVNDMETGLYVLFSSTVYDTQKEKETLETLTKNHVIMAIIDKETNKAIGICGLHNINYIHRTATYGITIGDKSYWGHGMGSEATTLILDFAFNILNINNIVLEVVDFNKRAINCYEKCGFKFIGTKRRAYYMAGQYHDLHLFDIVAEDFVSPYIKDIYNKAMVSDDVSSKITIV